jgi:general stress protein 26
MAQTNDPVVRLNDLINGIDFAMLTTVRPDGTLHSCPMAGSKVDRDGIIWFFAANNTEKVEAIRTSQRVNLAYVDHSAQRYISVSGYCDLVRDKAKAKELWNPDFRAWFPGGLDDPNLILLKVNVQQSTYWDAARGRMTQLLGLANAAVG